MQMHSAPWGAGPASSARGIAAVQRLTSQTNLAHCCPHRASAPAATVAARPPVLGGTRHSREVSTSRYLSAAHQGSCRTALRYLNLIKSASSAYAASASSYQLFIFQGKCIH